MIRGIAIFASLSLLLSVYLQYWTWETLPWKNEGELQQGM